MSVGDGDDFDRPHAGEPGGDPIWGDPDNESELAFFERLVRLRGYLLRLIGDYDAAHGFTAPAEQAVSAALSALDAAILSEEAVVLAASSEAQLAESSARFRLLEQVPPAAVEDTSADAGAADKPGADDPPSNVSPLRPAG